MMELFAKKDIVDGTYYRKKNGAFVSFEEEV